MSLKARGQDVTVQITIDGEPKKGSWKKLKNFVATPRTEIKTQGYLGETEDDIDQQHNGFDISFEVDNTDDETLSYMAELARRERAGLRPQNVTMLVIYNYREVAKITAENYREVFVKVDDQNVGGREANVSTKFSGKCKTSSLVRA